MTPEQFCYWLQGYTELGGPVPSEEQWKLICEHLQLVFTKVTSPNIPYKMYTDPPPVPSWLYDKSKLEVIC